MVKRYSQKPKPGKATIHPDVVKILADPNIDEAGKRAALRWSYEELNGMHRTRREIVRTRSEREKLARKLRAEEPFPVSKHLKKPK